ncbi:MAG: HepT-like ribonuclease domain-containing protein [Opitutaceae bacterium]|jgi:uncharacterized protein with HEPN domain
MPHSVRKLLIDISLACEETKSFCLGKDLAAFQSDRLLQLAIERQFEIIGEALYRLEHVDPENIQVKIPEYRKIIGFRNLIAHGYDTIDDASLWDFVTNRIPELLEKIRNY